MRILRAAVALAAVALVACSDDEERVHTASLRDGDYRVVAWNGFAPTDEVELSGLTAHLDRTTQRLAVTWPDETGELLAFSPRPREEWLPDCATMSSHYLNEVADLSPAPLRIASVTFATPVVVAKCGPRMILTDAPGDPTSPWLALDPQ